MNNTKILMVAVAVVIIYMMMKCRERYIPDKSAYRYGFVDTNPQRRIAGFFDHCSPENMADCKRNNPYEGLPLP